jgi:hypothetical protein
VPPVAGLLHYRKSRFKAALADIPRHCLLPGPPRSGRRTAPTPSAKSSFWNSARQRRNWGAICFLMRWQVPFFDNGSIIPPDDY